VRLPRNAKIFRGQLDAAPFAGVFFCLVILLLMTSRLAFTTGVDFETSVPIELPAVGQALPGVQNAIDVVAVDGDGLFHYENQVAVSMAGLIESLKTTIKRSTTPLTLVILADRRVTWDTLADLLASTRNLGFQGLQLRTRPASPAMMPPSPPVGSK
jgi:biopolymer transport protein ExbD